MARAPLVLSSSAVYHVTARSNNKEWFYIPMVLAWDIFEEMLRRIADSYGVEIHAFVMMANHFHLLLSTPDRNLPQAMRYFMTESSRHIGRAAGRVNHVYGGRNKPNVLWNDHSLAFVYKYVYRNPVRAGISGAAEAYPYSTLQKQLHGHCRIPIVEGFAGIWKQIPKPLAARLEWLNKPTPKELEALVSVALRRRNFQFSRDKDLAASIARLAECYSVVLERALDNPAK